MKNKIHIRYYFIWILFGQIESRKISKGQVRNDLAPVENVIVFDANQKGCNHNEYGFTVLAKWMIPWFFQVSHSNLKKVVLKEEDFITPQFVKTSEVSQMN
jgi:hypothetical protein